ncbi:MAG: polysaccharide biosynthesis C-terminal domain-containing protein [Lachnospiraceae bacterium]|nr:polysaccharide biosynthesis C-terminal domain-containing protein [Lachnospiraceae bacterium]
MSKLKLFVENFIIYGLGGMINKLIPLIMIPIITRLMPDSTFYGISDMANTIVSFGTAIAVMGMYDAMYRMFFEKEEMEYKKKVCSTTLVFVIFTAAVTGILIVLFKDIMSERFLGSAQYSFIIYLVAFNVFIDAVNTVVASPTRMQNHRKTYLATNFTGPFLSYSMSIILLMKGHYLIAMPLGLVISSVTINVTYLIINRSWFFPRLFDAELLKVMLPIGIPMAVNILTYWVFNSCDRLMITNLINVGESGVYAIGSKLGHASQLVYTAFAAGWQYFAFSTMKEGDQVESNSMVFEYLGVVSYVITMFVCAFSYDIFRLLFTEEYLRGYIVAPYLFLAPLLLMLFQVIANQFLVIKKTWPNMLILIAGALMNVGLNYCLIPVMGIEGAAIATLAGYVAALLIASIVLVRMKLLRISGRFIIATTVMAAVMLVWRFEFTDRMLPMIVTAVAGGAVVVLLYIKDLKMLYGIVMKRGS